MLTFLAGALLRFFALFFIARALEFKAEFAKFDAGHNAMRKVEEEGMKLMSKFNSHSAISNIPDCDISMVYI